jgi:hypothetical protein
VASNAVTVVLYQSHNQQLTKKTLACLQQQALKLLDTQRERATASRTGGQDDVRLSLVVIPGPGFQASLPCEPLPKAGNCSLPSWLQPLSTTGTLLPRLDCVASSVSEATTPSSYNAAAAAPRQVSLLLLLHLRSSGKCSIAQTFQHCCSTAWLAALSCEMHG